jgi:hypothetical protein
MKGLYLKKTKPTGSSMLLNLLQIKVENAKFCRWTLEHFQQ